MRKVKHFRCPKCGSVETQESWVAEISHEHSGKIYKCERIDEDEPKGEVGKPRGNKSRYYDGITGKPIV